MFEEYMGRAIELAKGGIGKTNPNPLVGAVIVKDDRIIGEGFHHKYGDLHAERDALRDCLEKGNDPAGATIFVTLEPCCHQGKQPPCTEALVQSGIKKVYVGSRDPNPLVHGKGNAFLREQGVEVIEDFMREECDALNEIFFHFITTETPYVALKYAMTMDGKIATKTGASQWITNQESLAHVHTFRNKYAAILCGIGTILADDSMLTCRIEGGRNPLRIIMDNKLRTPLDSNIVKTAKDVPTIICSSEIDTSSPLMVDYEKKIAAYEKAGIEVLNEPDLTSLMKELASRNIDSVLIEGGAEINYSAIKEGIVNKIYAFIAPKIFGGRDAKTPVAGHGVKLPDDAFQFKLVDTEMFNGDIMLEYVKNV